MQKLSAEDYFKKYKAGECTPQEHKIISDYMLKVGGTSKSLEEMKAKLDELSSRVLQIPYARKTINWPLRIVLVAATIAIVATIWTVLFTKNPGLPANYANDVAPGENTAVLTLSNGQKIQLSNAKTGVIIDAAKLSYNDGTVIRQSQSDKKGVGINQNISTPKGGQYQIVLPDGSKVWLNAASSLTYSIPLQDSTGVRHVKLNGEAYFEIAKDVKHPFVVTTDQQKVEVLGTHFNVSAYRDDRVTKTTLTEGRVVVTPTSADHIKTITLNPNQEAILTSSDIKMNEVDSDEALAWKNGEFAFASEKLESILKKVARWYNVDIVYADESAAQKLFSGSISRFKNVSQLLCLLEITGEVKFKIEGRRVMVTN